MKDAIHLNMERLQQLMSGFSGFLKVFTMTVLGVISYSWVCAQQPNLVWANGIGGTGVDYSTGIATDKAGNVYITGYFTGTVDFDPGPGTAFLTPQWVFSQGWDNDVFIAKYDAQGRYIWAKNVGGYDDDRGYAIAVDTMGNLYVTGLFREIADFNPGVAGSTSGLLAATGYNDIFLAKYDTAGHHVWERKMGGSSDDIGESLVVNNTGSIYVTGRFKNAATFDPVGTLNAEGETDVFLFKMSSCDIYSSRSETVCGSFTFNGTTYTASGEYLSVFATGTAGCDSIVVLDLTVNTSPASVVREGVTLNASSGDSYQWIDCEDRTVIPGATNQSYTATETGSYAVVVTINGCNDTSDCADTEVPTAVSELNPGNRVHLYPNPAGNEVTIQTVQAVNNAVIRIVNTMGQLLLEQTGMSGYSFILDISQYSPGVYFVEIGEAGKPVRMKLTKQ